MAKALIGPTGYDSFGIAWREFPSLFSNGRGYSGPFVSQEAAETRAREIAQYHEVQLESITRVENVNELED